jgi:SAM-dependent methyltransferase
LPVSSFEDLITDAARAPFEGWDFAWLDARMVESPLSWDYVAQVGRVRRRLTSFASKSILDLGTGGGEILSQLSPFRALTVATEAYPPNAIVAARRLKPLGAHVVAHVVAVDGAPENYTTLATPTTNTPAIPFRDRAFDLVLNRHESFLPAEVFRILRPGGFFLTQQCGGTNCAGLNDLLGLPPPRFESWNLSNARAQLQSVGFEILDAREDFTTVRFHDVGAIVYFLNAAPWQAPDFDLHKSRQLLAELHAQIEKSGPLKIKGHHFLLEAKRPARS